MIQPTWGENGSFSDAACTMEVFGRDFVRSLPLTRSDSILIVLFSGEAL